MELILSLGLLLLSRTPLMSKEPRPVYAQEMDFLGLDIIWEYEKQQEVPHLWAESNVYWYRGQVVGKTSGGSLYEAPEFQLTLQESQNRGDAEEQIPVLPERSVLIPVDIPKVVDKQRNYRIHFLFHCENDLSLLYSTEKEDGLFPCCV